MITSNILNDFEMYLNTKQKYSLEEMLQMLENSYLKYNNINEQEEDDDDDDDDKPKKRGRPVNKPKLDKNGLPKKKREPTAYNRFIKIKIKELKESNDDVQHNKLLSMAAEIWSKMSNDEKQNYKNES